MTDLTLIWAILFVIGVVLMAIANNGGPGYFVRIAWILWALAAVIWFIAGNSSDGLHGLIFRRPPL